MLHADLWRSAIADVTMARVDTKSLESGRRSRWHDQTWVLFLFVALLAMVIYRPSFDAEFQALDDPQYTYANAYILLPTWEKLGDFFTEYQVPSTVAGYYQPLAMASLMLDRVVEGRLRGGYSSDLDPFLYHFTNVFLHGLNAALVFLLVYYFSRNRGIGLFCGLLFAVHPVNVEAVAWVSQRKAVLATSFAILMLIIYGRYAKTRHVGWYGIVVFTYALSMLAKPTGMLLPFVLILADIWPLKRLSGRAIVEKLPLVAMAIVGGYVAYVSQRDSAGLSPSLAEGNPWQGLLVFCYNVVFYPAKAIAPVALCPQYPMPSLETIRLSAVPFLLGVVGTFTLSSLIVLAFFKKWRPVWVCLVAFLLLLGPALSPRRFMGAITADRFCYQPLIPLIFLLAAGLRWTLAERRKSLLHRFGGRNGLVVIGLAVLSLFGYLTYRQQSVWKTTETYFSRVREVFPNDPFGYYGMGQSCLRRHDHLIRDPGSSKEEGDALLDEAMGYFQKTIEAEPTYSVAYYRMGEILALQGDVEKARDIIAYGFALPRSDTSGLFYLAWANSLLGEYEQAIPLYYEYLRGSPSHRESRRNLGNALLRTGRAAESLPQFAELYRIDPRDMEGLQNWAVALIQLGRADEAMPRLQSVVQTRRQRIPALAGEAKLKELSNLADAAYTLAGAQALTRDPAGCLRSLRAALTIRPDLLPHAKRHIAFEPLRQSEDWRQLILDFEETGQGPPTSPTGG